MRIAGYASVFDVADAGADVVRRGAFAGVTAGGLPLLWQHDGGEPVGVIESLSEDARGLRVVARIAGTRRGADARALVKAKALDGLSIGYRVKDFRPSRRGRELLRVELIEVSLVTFPMQRLARVLGWAESDA